METQAFTEGENPIIEWVDANIGGEVVRIVRQPRWRPVWWVDVVRDGGRLELCVRGDRTDFPGIFPLEHEMLCQRLLHEHGLPVAGVHGWIGGEPDPDPRWRRVYRGREGVPLPRRALGHRPRRPLSLRPLKRV